MNVLIRAELINPPSTFGAFRDITLYISTFTVHCVLIEVLKENQDMYYYWLKERGGMDFIEDFVPPGIEYGYRIDTTSRFPCTVVETDRIIPENVHQILGRLQFWLPSK